MAIKPSTTRPTIKIPRPIAPMMGHQAGLAGYWWARSRSIESPSPTAKAKPASNAKAAAAVPKTMVPNITTWPFPSMPVMIPRATAAAVAKATRPAKYLLAIPSMNLLLHHVDRVPSHSPRQSCEIPKENSGAKCGTALLSNTSTKRT